MGLRAGGEAHRQWTPGRVVDGWLLAAPTGLSFDDRFVGGGDESAGSGLESWGSATMVRSLRLQRRPIQSSAEDQAVKEWMARR